MSNFWQRTFSGIVYVAVVIGAILSPVPLVFSLVFATFCALTIYEFYKLMNKKENVKINFVFPVIAAIALFFLFSSIVSFSNIYGDGKVTCLSPLVVIVPWFLISTYLISCLLAFIFQFFKKNTAKNINYILLGQLYIALPFAISAIIRGENAILLLAVFVSIWANDTFAYLIGSAIGKHKMCPKISPKKSWEGFVGGVLGALTIGFIFSFFVKEMNVMQWLIFAFIISIFGTLGDLLESVLKRSVGVKDSGAILPGHGGLLDRFDSLLLAAPAVYVYWQLF